MRGFYLPLMVIAGIVVLTHAGCSEEDEGIDMTMKVVGTYIGSYEESDSGFTIEFEDVVTEVDKKSSDEITIDMHILPGLVTVAFDAKMTSDTQFTVPAFTFDDDEVSGFGSLMNENTIEIILESTEPGGSDGKYTGQRQ